MTAENAETQRPTVRDDLQSMVGYHSPQVDVSVRLNTNESPFAPPAAFANDVADAVRSLDWHRYPDRGATDLRQRLAGIFGLDATQVFAANGSNEVLQTLLLTYAGPNRTVATFEPTYALHRHIATVVGSRVVSGERDEHFAIQPAAATSLIAQESPIVTFLCSPNNPSGVLESQELVLEVLDAVRSVNGLLVVDEAYAEFSPWSAVELVNEDTPLVVTRTYSKTWSMAAARLGYMLGPSWVVERLEAVVLPYHLDAITQAAGLAALDHVDEMNERVGLIIAERERISGALDALAVERWPSSSNFVLFRPLDRSGQGVWEELLARDILVRNCATWPGLDDCLRVTIGTPEENEAFLVALKEILSP